MALRPTADIWLIRSFHVESFWPSRGARSLLGETPGQCVGGRTSHCSKQAAPCNGLRAAPFGSGECISGDSVSCARCHEWLSLVARSHRGQLFTCSQSTDGHKVPPVATAVPATKGGQTRVRAGNTSAQPANTTTLEAARDVSQHQAAPCPLDGGLVSTLSPPLRGVVLFGSALFPSRSAHSASGNTPLTDHAGNTTVRCAVRHPEHRALTRPRRRGGYPQAVHSAGRVFVHSLGKSVHFRRSTVL